MLTSTHHRVPTLVAALTALAWLTAPWTRLGGGMGFRLATTIGILALVAAYVFLPSSRNLLYVPRLARWHFIGIGLLVLGFVGGQLVLGPTLSSLATPVGYGMVAALPVVLLLRIGATETRLVRLAQWFTIGAALSVLAAPLLQQTAGIGRWIGAAGHMNQLAATCVMALPLVRLCFAGKAYRVPARLVLFGILLVGIQQSGARSGLIGALVVISFLVINWIARGPQRFLVGVLLLLGAWVAAPSIETQDYGDQSAIGRLTTDEQILTDASRRSLLEEALTNLSSQHAIIGGAAFERSPHNVYLETWAVGGLLAAAGLILVLARPSVHAVRSVLTRAPLPLSGRLAISVVGYMVVTFFNNALWFPYTWAILGLFVVAMIRERSPDHDLADAAA